MCLWRKLHVVSSDVTQWLSCIVGNVVNMIWDIQANVSLMSFVLKLSIKSPTVL